MSRHRFIKTLDVDEELDEVEGDYDDEEDPQMQEALGQAREILGNGFTDKEIEDSLWYYYYDVEKTVNYLLNRKTSTQNKKADNTPKKSKEPSLSHEAIQPRLSSRRKSSVPQGFFDDCPWLNVPSHRHAALVPVYCRLRGGLLGGSSQGNQKVSKLATLAAARRKKENKNRPVNPSNTSIALLDKLSKPSAAKEIPDDPSASDSDPKAHPKPFQTRKYPLKKQAPNLAAEETTTSPPPEPATNVDTNTSEAPVPTATPSPFAKVIFGYSPVLTHQSSFNENSASFHSLDLSIAEDVFAGPSPDDIVANAQSTSKGLKGSQKPTAKSVNSKKDVNGVTKELSKAAITESPRPKSKNIDVLKEYRKTESKKAVNFVVIGHVDAGKSTLMGRLLYDLKVVDQRTLDRYHREAEKLGKASFALAWVLDEGTDEREHGVTIDIAMNKFATESTAFTILDAPGHRDLVPNMIAGAAQADFAVLVVDASTGSFESGLRGQTREHALLVRSMGVQRLIVVVNKLDSVDWSKERFDEIRQQTSAFLTAAGFQTSKISFVPCSGIYGDNITKRSEACPWYDGPILVELLENSEPVSQSRVLDGPLRLPISDVFSAGTQYPISVAGRLTSGSVQIGDKVLIMPSKESAFIKALDVDEEPAEWAVAGQNATLHLSDVDATNTTVKGGDVVCAFNSPVPSRTTFPLKILAFGHVVPMFVSVVVGRLDVPGRVSKLVSLIDKSTGKAETGSKKKPRIVKPGAAARIEIEVQVEGGVPLEEGARVVLRAEGETVATGLIEPFGTD